MYRVLIHHVYEKATSKESLPQCIYVIDAYTLFFLQSLRLINSWLWLNPTRRFSLIVSSLQIAAAARPLWVRLTSVPITSELDGHRHGTAHEIPGAGNCLMVPIGDEDDADGHPDAEHGFVRLSQRCPGLHAPCFMVPWLGQAEDGSFTTVSFLQIAAVAS
jgi:hypothetical protein